VRREDRRKKEREKPRNWKTEYVCDWAVRDVSVILNRRVTRSKERRDPKRNNSGSKETKKKKNVC